MPLSISLEAKNEEMDTGEEIEERKIPLVAHAHASL